MTVVVGTLRFRGRDYSAEEAASSLQRTPTDDHPLAIRPSTHQVFPSLLLLLLLLLPKIKHLFPQISPFLSFHFPHFISPIFIVWFPAIQSARIEIKRLHYFRKLVIDQCFSQNFPSLQSGDADAWQNWMAMTQIEWMGVELGHPWFLGLCNGTGV